MEEMNYESPLVKVVTVAVEQGFAASYEYTNGDKLEKYESVSIDGGDSF